MINANGQQGEHDAAVKKKSTGTHITFPPLNV